MDDKLVIVISGPSGVGKTTLYKQILQRYQDKLDFSISATTRSIRKGEQNGVDYYFLRTEEFQKRIVNNDFLEWENNYGNFYGTLKREVERIWNKGKHCFLDLDVKGGLKIKNIFGDKSVLIFIEPPSLDVLIERLKARGSNDENIIERVQHAQEEISQGHRYHYSIVNKDLDAAFEELDRLIRKILKYS